MNSFWIDGKKCSFLSLNTHIVNKLLFNDDQNKKKGRPIKISENRVLEGKSADNFNFQWRRTKEKKEGYSWLQP